jgi:hypothetical protein
MVYVVERHTSETPRLHLTTPDCLRIMPQRHHRVRVAGELGHEPHLDALRLQGRYDAVPVSNASGVDLTFATQRGREFAMRMSNPKLHQQLKFASGPLILTFAKSLLRWEANARIGPLVDDREQIDFD